MTNEQLTNEILHYIEDQSYNYAVMIDGEWGSGKTYYVKNELMCAIEKHEEASSQRKVKYCSLYGCNSVKDILNDLIWSLAAELLKKKKRNTTDKKKEGEKSLVRQIIKKSLSVLYRQIPFNEDIFSVLTDWLQTCSLVLIFDDLERCSCPLDEIFGFINGLVEHDGTKVILVANEKELCRISGKKAEPIEYLVALDNRIMFPKEGNNASYTVRSSDGDSISIKELEERKEKLFSSTLIDEEYKRKREKLIGTVLRFEADYFAICTSMIEKCNLSAEKKKMIGNELMEMDTALGYSSYHNLRTFQFFLSKVIYLLAEFEKFSEGISFRDIIESAIINECYRITLKFKMSVVIPEWKRIRVGNAPLTTFTSIQEYVEKGEYDYHLFKNEVQEYAKELTQSVLPVDPLNLLWNEFYLHPQEWCETRAKELLHQL